MPKTIKQLLLELGLILAFLVSVPVLSASAISFPGGTPPPPPPPPTGGAAAPSEPAASGTTSAETKGNLCNGANLEFADSTGDCNKDGNPQDKINNLVTQIVNVFSIIVGIVAVIMIIYGGFRYVTSGGDSGNITTAKNTILYAIVGLVIVALAQFIVKFVLNKSTGGGTAAPTP